MTNATTSKGWDMSGMNAGSREASFFSDEKPYVWKHRCAPNGRGGGFACEPPCTDPWQVHLTYPLTGCTFATFGDAIAWASAEATR